MKMEFSQEGNVIMEYVHRLQQAQDHNFKAIDKDLKSIQEDLKLIHKLYVTKVKLFEEIRELQNFIMEKLNE